MTVSVWKLMSLVDQVDIGFSVYETYLQFRRSKTSVGKIDETETRDNKGPDPRNTQWRFVRCLKNSNICNFRDFQNG